MSLQFTEGSIPEQVTAGRTREPNPFEGRFPTAEGKSLVVKLPANTDEEIAYAKKVKTQAQDEAKRTKDESHPEGYTARVKWEPSTEKHGKTEKAYVTLTIWTVDRIFRPRTEKVAESAS